MVSFLFILIVVSITGLICYRMIFKRKTPSNMYTPYDDMVMGKKDDVKRDFPAHDTKHPIEYEEKSDKDKSI
ncbi:DUF3951 domain-containing protein [Peribacillus simplex]|uniref:DUF3951 domain-containing protein n=2 Tax=Peribacillus TaxID=2675229 RepID=A0AA90SVM9_9BACI|nr:MULTISPECIES: DUF3951 domain-containing protein [Peribacillus]MDP1418069.1 DUF3951 domain-containing protein [Peribacillus simplex]MDP1450945.1 DUF3951 domain-containing protein [Peribacillus frigoritolerans]